MSHPSPDASTPRSTAVTLVCLHALGSSGEEFAEVARLLGDGFEVMAPDLPGFGDTPAAPGGSTVSELAAFVLREVSPRIEGPWLLVGHSMGGKIASLLATRAAMPDAGGPDAGGPDAGGPDGAPAGVPGGLLGVVLLAGSPLEPEPMDEERREEMLSWVADGPLDDAAAREFVAANEGTPPLEGTTREAALADLRRSSPTAWSSWLNEGSREDLSTGRPIDLPALIVAGGDDGDLGEDAQRRLNAPAYREAEVLVLAGAGHLLPLERPREVAEGIRRFRHRVAVA